MANVKHLSDSQPKSNFVNHAKPQSTMGNESQPNVNDNQPNLAIEKNNEKLSNMVNQSQH